MKKKRFNDYSFPGGPVRKASELVELTYNDNYTYEIKITGSGRRREIAIALRQIADAIYHETSMGHGKNLSDESIDGAEWEDATLMTEINKLT